MGCGQRQEPDMRAGEAHPVRQKGGLWGEPRTLLVLLVGAYRKRTGASLG